MMSVTEHVGLPTDALRLPADDDDGLPVAGEAGKVPVLDGLQRETLVPLTQLEDVVAAGLSLLLTLLLQLLQSFHSPSLLRLSNCLIIMNEVGQEDFGIFINETL